MISSDCSCFYNFPVKVLSVIFFMYVYFNKLVSWLVFIYVRIIFIYLIIYLFFFYLFIYINFNRNNKIIVVRYSDVAGIIIKIKMTVQPGVNIN